MHLCICYFLSFLICAFVKGIWGGRVFVAGILRDLFHLIDPFHSGHILGVCITAELCHRIAGRILIIPCCLLCSIMHFYLFMHVYLCIAFNYEQPTASAFLIVSFCVGTFIFVGECLGVLFCALFFHLGLAVNVMSVVISFFCKYCCTTVFYVVFECVYWLFYSVIIKGMMTGFISLNMPIVFDYLNYISPMYWGSNIMMNIVLSGLMIHSDLHSFIKYLF